MLKLQIIGLLFLAATLAGCSFDGQQDGAPTAEQVPVDISQIPDAVPRHEPRTRAGNPDSYEVLGKRYVTLKHSKGFRQRGIASWYGTKFHGRKTANGETYNMYAMTAAHKTLPIPSYVRVTHLNNHRSVIVRINDRGPFHGGRIIDLSYAAARKLGITKTGTGYVEIEAVEPGVKTVSVSKPKQAQVTNKSYQQLFLQIGAFKDRFNAAQLQQKVAQINMAPTRLKVAENQAGVLYKVWVGPLRTEAQARQVSSQLTGLGITEMSLVSVD